MKFIFDENLPRNLAMGLRYFGVDVEHVLDHFDQGTTDIEILKFVGVNGYFLITKDIRMRFNQAEIEALRRNNVGAFFLVGKTMKMWEVVKQLINSWEKIEEIANIEARPFIFTLRRSGKPNRHI